MSRLLGIVELAVGLAFQFARGVSMRSKPFLVVLAFLLTAIAASATIQEREPPNQGTALEGSNCQRCHGAASGFYLRSMYAIGVASTPLRANEPATLTITVQNDWLAQLRDLSARLDLTNAPAVGFSAKPPPVLGVTRSGNLSHDPLDVLALTQERTASIELPLPAGATAFRLELVPENQTGAQAPDLQLRLWPPNSDTKGPASIILDAAGKGGNEALDVPEATDALRSGTWLAEVAQDAWTNSTDDARLQAQSFRLVGDAWFKLTESVRAQTRPFPAIQLDGQDAKAATTSQVTWTLFLREAPAGNQTLSITVNTTAHYKHHPNSARYDDWPFTQSIELPVQAEGALIVDPQASQVIRSVGAPLEVAFSETVGYLGGFALVASMASGGAFGSGSRRALNRLLGSARRRIAFHNALSYGVILFSILHAILFVAETRYHWSAGLLWGGLAILGLFTLGLTGALQAPLIAAWGHRAWRWTHTGAGYLTFLLTMVHVGLDGAHFAWMAEHLHWSDPILEHFRIEG